jgi:hypothetical protein
MVLLSGRARNTGRVDSLATALEELEKLAHVHPRLPQIVNLSPISLLTYANLFRPGVLRRM